MKSSNIFVVLRLFTYTFTLVPSSNSADTPISDKLVPSTNIRGTKLYTGICYKISMKVFPQGWLTWVYSGNYIEVELNPSELPKYSPGQPFQYDHQWYFSATESDSAYTMTNRGRPLGSLLWVDAETGGGKHIAVYDDVESRKKMGPGGELRKAAMWIPSSSEGNLYKIESMDRRGHFITWTYKKHNDFNYYMQIAGYDAKHDSLFSFQPLNIVLEAKVYDFKFAETLEALIKKDGVRVTKELIKKKPLPFTDSDETAMMEESVEAKDSFTIEIKETLPMVRKTKISALMITDKELLIEGGFEKGKAKSIEIIKTLSFKQEIEVPAYTYVEASILAESLDDVEIPFTAKMQIVGFADRAVVDHPDKFKEGPVPAEVAEEFISSLGGKLEVISRSDENLVVQISGTLRGDIKVHLILDQNDTEIWSKE